MTLLSGRQLWNSNIIEGGLPFKADDGVLPSYGLDGMLYTLRIDVDFDKSYLSPGQFRVFKTLERVNMPTSCGGYLFLKSTYSRKGIILTTNSPVDPGYYGSLTVGLFNASEELLTIYGQGGFMQLAVHTLTENVAAYNGRWQER